MIHVSFLIQVFYRERLNGHYGVAVFILSNFLSSFPYLVAISVATGTITFYMVKFRSEFSHYVFFCLNLFSCIAVVESCMMVVASLVPNFLMGIITGAGLIVSGNTELLDEFHIFHFQDQSLDMLTSFLAVNAGNHDDDFGILPFVVWSSQAFLALSCFIYQLWGMGTTGNSMEKYEGIRNFYWRTVFDDRFPVFITSS